jgi:hypothetical protein
VRNGDEQMPRALLVAQEKVLRLGAR